MIGMLIELIHFLKLYYNTVLECEFMPCWIVCLVELNECVLIMVQPSLKLVDNWAELLI